MKKPNRARLSLDLDASTKQNFEKVQKREGIGTLTDLIKKSIALFDITTAHQKSGGAVIFRNQDGTEQRVVLL